MESIVKLCECGCGLLAPIATRNSTRDNMVKGEPMRRIRGHAMGKYEIDRSIRAAKDLACRRRYKAKMKARGKEYIAEYLATHPCADCGESNPLVLDFHHRNPGEKFKSIADLICVQHASVKKLKQEVEKCDVICSNCHRIRHQLGSGGKRQ